MKRIIMDLDETICSTQAGKYAESTPNIPVINKLREYKALGFEIVISTSRNMRTYSGNVGKITANTLPVIMDWLARHDVPFDEIYVGKPWCGHEGFYVDDKAIRPEEFANLSYDEIKMLTGIET
ncbi:capsular biosynthesis protein [Pseudomonas sp. GD03860]|uniref:capsular biosynthesis protein n=1 Tax=Pseudomonas TaxID=286 RepID=UPI0023645ABE|nr:MULTISPECIES: capsular biosynthesis protein [Pseudomonas]MDD2056364.1 capsular biosynthesis protein [Pseudomonas putida]MDH0637268.1 capsular biosynthesis protein [Pseudomonas sp. GD03860]